MKNPAEKIRRLMERQTLSMTIIAVLVAVFIPLAILIGWYAMNERDSSLEKTTQKSLTTLAAQVGSEVGRVLSHASQDIKTLSENPLIKDDADSTESIEAKRAEMERVQQSYAIFADITLISADGEVITSTTYEYQGDWEGKEWFQEALSDTATASEPYILLNPDRAVMSFASPVTDPKGNVKAVISGQMSMATIWQITSNAALGETGHARIIDDNGNYIAHPDQSRFLTPLEYPINGLLSSSASGIPQPFECKNSEGQKLIGVSAVLDVSSYTGGNTWHILMCQSKDETFGPVRDASSRVATGAIVAFILFLIISGLLIRKTTRPILELEAGVRKVGAGEFTYRAQVSGTREFRQFSTAFNEMVRDLQMSESLHSEHNLLKKLQAASTALAGATSPEEVLRTMSSGIREIFASEVTWILLAENDGQYLETRVFDQKESKTSPERSTDSTMVTIGERINLSGRPDLLIKTFKEGRPLFLDDISPFKDLSKNDPVLGIMGDDLGITSINLIPLTLQNKTIGVIIFGRDQGKPLSDTEKRSILVFGYQSAISLERARLHSVEIETAMETKRMSDLRARLLHILSHELKTPLTSLSSSSRLLHESDLGIMDTKNLERLVSNISRATEKLVRVADDIYPLADILSGRMQMHLRDTDCCKVVEQAIEVVSPLTERKSQTVNLSIPDSPPRIMADRERLEQVLTNLITNSSNLSAEETEIDIRLHDKPYEVVFAVQDQGIGIAEEDQKSILDGFYQADNEIVRRAGGKGLGLVFAKTIVELHGGKLWFESKLGQGSTFYFSIPKSNNPPSA